MTGSDMILWMRGQLSGSAGSASERKTSYSVCKSCFANTCYGTSTSVVRLASFGMAICCLIGATIDSDCQPLVYPL
eukprot:205680-Amphidinium_carterae.1